MIIDLTQVEEAFGSSTTYFGGILVVDGNNVVVDGWTDRSTTPSDHAFNMLTEEAKIEFSDDLLEEIEETWNQEISCGNTYDVVLNAEGITIKEIPDETAKATDDELFNAMELGIYACIELQEIRTERGQDHSEAITARIDKIRDVQSRIKAK